MWGLFHICFAVVGRLYLYQFRKHARTSLLNTYYIDVNIAFGKVGKNFHPYSHHSSKEMASNVLVLTAGAAAIASVLFYYYSGVEPYMVRI